jgi:glycosyltransferase involved in cell wall biosynthesis
MILSIVIATLNRRPLLVSAVTEAKELMGNIPHEFIIVDGGSTDGTIEWVRSQPCAVLIAQGQRVGAVRAFNEGFRAARGKYVVNLNDDVVFYGNPLTRAIKQLDSDDLIGQIAIPFQCPGEMGPRVDSLVVGNPRREMLYANFGVTRKSLGDQVGWWGNLTYQYNGDPNLSLGIWSRGYKVVKLDGCGYIGHLEAKDATRQPNTDSHLLFQAWNSWAGPV